VTGGSRGIGAAIVKTLSSHGCNVAFTYLSSPEKAIKIEKELMDEDTKIIAYKCDVGDYIQAEELISNIVKDFGGLDIVVNNAGITKDNLILRMTEDQWDAVMQTNLKSLFNITKPAMKHLMRKGGSIINISSVVGVFGNAGQSNYAASKAGIFGFTKSIAKEMGSRNVRCNAIAPGYIETEMTQTLDEKVKESFWANIPLKRMGTAEEVADSVVFLASDMAKYINGQVLSVCGGLNC
ncbi:MAG: 3-oxoacyl-[acyl-carrier-protein] reductase, partial [Saprospiraceae bacterium]|nr:3-oxoacyl-[acyl-carrier-protein] reductase [Saprospiraceae bacterium]